MNGPLNVQMQRPCRFCRREWLSWLSAMHEAALEAGMLPGQQNGPRAFEDTGAKRPEELGVLLIVAGDGDIAAVNVRNLGCTGPTNILSFPEDGAVGTLFLLLAHGMGHILGFDHGPEMDEFCMWLESCCVPDEERAS